MDDALLRVQGLSFTYPKGKVIFDDAAFSLTPAERVAITGDNGAGKTTLFRILTGLIIPQAGNVYFKGQVVSDEAGFQKLRAKVGFVLQEAEDQLFFSQVIDDVAFGPLNLGLTDAQAKEAALTALDTFGMKSFANALTHELSGGQKKLVAMASVIAMAPEVLLLDEPTNALDAKARGRLETMMRESRAAMLVISHDEAFLRATCTRFLVIENGKIKER